MKSHEKEEASLYATSIRYMTEFFFILSTP